MTRRRTTCAIAVLALGTTLLSTTDASAARTTASTTTSPTTARAAASAGGSPSLRVTPERFVGGQALTFVGRLPSAPGADLKIQTRFDRPGDGWITRPGVVGRTDGGGAFSFVHPAPSNFGVSYRVKAVGGPSGPAFRFEPRQQEVALSFNGGAEQAAGTVRSGATFRIDVDTTHTGRGTLGRPAPAFPGRPLALQQRVSGNQWSTVATSAASSQGTAQFVLTAGSPGQLAYRVRQAALTNGENRIGWFPSHPLAVRVVPRGASGRTTAPAPASAPARSSAPALAPAPVARPTRGGAQAGQRFRWGPTQWDFAWERGEALTDPPARGRQRTGKWIDRSNGSGRAAPYNGGMSLSTHISEFPGKGDRGTTSVTLDGNARPYGRWEFRRRIDVFEKAGRAYRVKIELVPARAEDARCGSNSITVADVAYNSATARIGLSSLRARKAWKGSRRIARLGPRPHSFAVEVTRGHVTWFLDGRSLATVRSKRAAPGVPLTPRLSLVGRGGKEMQRTRVIYDWQRGWKLNKQARTAPKGPGLKAKKVAKSC